MIKTKRDKLIEIITERKVTVTDGVVCHSGETTTTYLDIPGALADAKALQVAVAAFLDRLIGIKGLGDLTAIVGPQMGAIPLVMGFTMHWGDEMKWAIVRDKVKDHGLGGQFVGAKLGPQDYVIITDDVVSTGNSLEEVIDTVLRTGAKILAVVPLVDRGVTGRAKVEALGIPYLPVLTHEDLGMPVLGAA